MKGYGDSEAYKKLLREFNSDEAGFLKIAKSPRIPAAAMLRELSRRFNKVFNQKTLKVRINTAYRALLIVTYVMLQILMSTY